MIKSIFFSLINARSSSKGFENNNLHVSPEKQIVGQTQKIHEELLYEK